jgi:hypothetical protein
MKHYLPWEAALAATLGMVGWASSELAQPTMQQHWPVANAAAAAPNEGVRIQFEPASSNVLHLPPLWVHSAQRGGQRAGSSGQLVRVGRQLCFRPTYDFPPGEVVYATTWGRPRGQPGGPAPALAVYGGDGRHG